MSPRECRVATGALTVLVVMAGCRGPGDPVASFEVTEAKMATDVNADRQPLNTTSEFPPGTDQVHCWFAWKNARPGLPLTARWHYQTDRINILNLRVALNRASDTGAFTLRMPPGKTLPPGEYRIELEVKGKLVKSVPFTVQSASAQTPSAQTPPAQASREGS